MIQIVKMPLVVPFFQIVVSLYSHFLEIVIIDLIFQLLQKPSSLKNPITNIRTWKIFMELIKINIFGIFDKYI